MQKTDLPTLRGLKPGDFCKNHKKPGDSVKKLKFKEQFKCFIPLNNMNMKQKVTLFCE